MNLFTQIQTADRYLPWFKLADGATLQDLFESWSLCEFKDRKPSEQRLDFSVCVRNFYNGKHLYLVPTAALAEVLAGLSIYGAPVLPKDIMFMVDIQEDGRVWLRMQFQQIIGSYVICELPEDLYTHICRMHYAPVGAGPVVPLETFYSEEA